MEGFSNESLNVVCLCYRDHAVSHVAIHAVGIFTDTSIHRYVEVYVENAAVGVWHGVDAVDEKGLGFEERSLARDNRRGGGSSCARGWGRTGRGGGCVHAPE